MAAPPAIWNKIGQNFAYGCFFCKCLSDIRNSILIYNRWDVTCAGHCDDGPVQRLRQCEEHRVRLVLGGEK